MPSPVWIVLSILGTVVFLLLCPLLILMLVAAVWPDAIQPAFRLVLWPVYRLKVLGRENVPKTGPVLVIANHISWMDGFVLAATLGRRGRALVYAPYLNVPVLGRLAKRSGMIPVPERGPKAQQGNVAGGLRGARPGRGAWPISGSSESPESA